MTIYDHMTIWWYEALLWSCASLTITLSSRSLMAPKLTWFKINYFRNRFLCLTLFRQFQPKVANLKCPRPWIVLSSWLLGHDCLPSLALATCARKCTPVLVCLQGHWTVPGTDNFISEAGKWKRSPRLAFGHNPELSLSHKNFSDIQIPMLLMDF